MNTNKENILKKHLSKKCIYNITPFTLLDFTDKTACILWFVGCNMRCTYCYNPEIVLGKGKLSFDDILPFLQSRIGLLDGVVFSGGECLLQTNILDIIWQVKELGFSVKIDTNGSKPEILQTLIEEKLVDFVSLDYKAPEHKFEEITKSSLYNTFIKSFQILQKAQIPFEVRTTIHSQLLDTKDILSMQIQLEALGYQGVFYVQKFQNDVKTLGNLAPSKPYFKELETSPGICLR
ncbi:MAG: anaerobic ribonucleoside-triphosphate reductase activating protein [Saprospiraceae bacterium]